MEKKNMESRQNLTLFPEGRRSGRLAHRLPEVCGAKWCWKVAQGQSTNRAEDGQIRLVGIGFFAVLGGFERWKLHIHKYACVSKLLEKKNFHGVSVSLLTIN